MSPIAAAAVDTASSSSDGHAHGDAVASHCALASDELRIQEALVEAGTVLADDDWRWVRELLDAMHDSATERQSKLFFLRLLRASDSAAMDVVLGEMESWRDALQGGKSSKTSLGSDKRKGVQALFLLGVDKQMSLARCP